MSVVKFFKTTSLPATLEADSVYLVGPANTPEYLEVYVTNSAGTAQRRIPTVADIQAMITTALTNSGGVTLVADITERDALTPHNGMIVLVRDASADPSVDSGAATYVWDGSANSGAGDWVKISEFESLDLVLDWSNIVNGPSSSPAAIDTAVAQTHTHANKTELDKIGEDADGNLTYGGLPPRARLEVQGW